MAARTVMWFAWVVMAFVTACYGALSLATFANIYNSLKTVDKIENLLPSAAVAALGSVLVAIYLLMSFLVILSKTIFKSGAGFSYGFITSSSIHMAVTGLLCGVVLNSSQPNIRNALEAAPASDYWREVHDEVFLATFIMAYVSSFVYTLFFCVLVCTRRGVQKISDLPSFTSTSSKEVRLRIDSGASAVE